MENRENVKNEWKKLNNVKNNNNKKKNKRRIKKEKEKNKERHEGNMGNEKNVKKDMNEKNLNDVKSGKNNGKEKNTENEKGKNKKTKVSKKKVIRLIVILLVIVLIICLIVLLISKLTSKTETTEVVADLDVRHMGVTDESAITTWSDEVTVYVDESMEDDSGETVTQYVPIPKGYAVSTIDGETTVKEGLVIYEGEEAVTSVSKTTRNQWVWVPVNPSNVYYTNSSGKKYGIYHTFSSSGVTSANNTYEPMIKNSNQYAYEDYYYDRYLSYKDSLLELYAEMQLDFNNMVDSIEKYGGFYIARYEIGGSVTTPTEVQGQTVLGSTTWYKLYDASKNFNTDENVFTSMIWGTLWDNTLMWLVESGDKTYSQIVDSCDWGNYNNSIGDAATGSGSIRTSGYNEAWKACNIYDLAGNCLDWTLEAYSSSNNFRYNRGGYYSSSGSSNPSSNRYLNYPYNSSTYLSCRVALYIQ